MRLVLLVIFSFSIVLGTDVKLILTGFIMDNASSHSPLAGSNIKAHRVEDYPAYNNLDTSSVIGSGKSDPTGFFMIPMTGFTNLKNDDSIRIQFENFEYCNSVKNLRNKLIVYNDSKMVNIANMGQSISRECIAKGDTVTIRPGESKSYYTFDPVFGPPSMPLSSSYADMKILPEWVTIDECTSWVCIRMQAPVTPGVITCKLSKQIDANLNYTFDFFVRITQNTDVEYNVNYMHTSSGSNVTIDKFEKLGKSLCATITAYNPQVLEIELFNVRGEIIGKKHEQYFMPGKNNIYLKKPNATGLYYLRIKSRHTYISREILIQN